MNTEKQNTDEQEFERQERELARIRALDAKFRPVVDAFANAVNGFSYKDQAEGFINAFQLEHRTLQQNMFRTMLSLIEFMASDEFKTDQRNEDSKKVAQDLLQGYNLLVEKKFGYISGGWKPSQSLGTV